MLFFRFRRIPYEGVFHMLYPRKKVKIDNKIRYFHTWWLYSRNNEKIEGITIFLIPENTRNKQTIKEKD